MKPDVICIFIGPSISIFISGCPICSALFFKLIFKNNKFLYLYYRMLRHYQQELRKQSYFKFTYGNFNYRGRLNIITFHYLHLNISFIEYPVTQLNDRRPKLRPALLLKVWNFWIESNEAFGLARGHLTIRGPRPRAHHLAGTILTWVVWVRPRARHLAGMILTWVVWVRPRARHLAGMNLTWVVWVIDGVVCSRLQALLYIVGGWFDWLDRYRVTHPSETHEMNIGHKIPWRRFRRSTSSTNMNYM
jgi:hypothetical protein